MKKVVKRIAAGALAAGVLSTGLVGTAAAPASAASVVGRGIVKLCVGGNYDARIQLASVRVWSSTIVRRNSCLAWNIGGGGMTERIEFRGRWNTNPGDFVVHVHYVNLDNAGIGVTVAGTTTNPTHTVW